MGSYEVYIPTKGSVGQVAALEMFPEAVLCVPDAESAAYSMFCPGKVVAVPAESGEELADIYNFALDMATAEHVLLVGPDVYGVGYYDGDAWHELPATFLRGFIEDGFRLCREAGTVLWGLNPSGDKADYQVFAPFSLLDTVPGLWAGHIRGHGLRYDERVGPHLDVDLTLQAIHRYRRVWRMNKYHALRTNMRGFVGRPREEIEAGERAYEALQWKWGRRVIRDYEAEALKVRVSVPIPGR